MRGEGALVDARARQRAAVEMARAHASTLKRTARRFSLDAEDAEDAYQRALEIALTKAPTTDPRDLLRWTQTVVRHEAMAVRRSRERLFSRPPAEEPGAPDPVTTIPDPGGDPGERVEGRERIARGREALQTLKPAERQALGLLAEGYSYAEISQMTGFSATKVNRVLAEGRARFRSVVAGSEDGSRCHELRPLLSAFCDGETTPKQALELREHLRACAGCRAAMRAYRAAPAIVAALPLSTRSRSLLGRLHDLVAGAASRLPGVGGGDPALTQIATGAGGRGVGMAGLAKAATVCLGAAGGAAVCVATGVLPAPDLLAGQPRKPAIERPAQVGGEAASAAALGEAPPQPSAAEEKPKHTPKRARQPRGEAGEVEASADAGAIEYEAPPPVEAAPEPAAAPVEVESSPEAGGGGSAAGEFGP